MSISELLYTSFPKDVQVADLDNRHKFRLDVDGFGWTTRFREELSKNNVVIKVTLYVSFLKMESEPSPRSIS